MSIEKMSIAKMSIAKMSIAKMKMFSRSQETLAIWLVAPLGLTAAVGCNQAPENDYYAGQRATDAEIDEILERAGEIRRLGACLGGGDSDSCESICPEGSACEVGDQFQFVQETLVDTDGYSGHGFGKVVSFFTGSLNYVSDPQCITDGSEASCFDGSAPRPQTLLTRDQVEALTAQYDDNPTSTTVEFDGNSYELGATLSVGLRGVLGHDHLSLPATGRAVAFERQDVEWHDAYGFFDDITVQGCVEYRGSATNFDPFVDLVEVVNSDELQPIHSSKGTLHGDLQGTVVESCAAWEYGLDEVDFYYGSDGKRHVVNPCARLIEGTEIVGYHCALGPQQVSQDAATAFSTHAKWVSGVAFAAAALSNLIVTMVTDGALEGILAAGWGATTAAEFLVPARLALAGYGVLSLADAAVALEDCRATGADCTLQTEQFLINIAALAIASRAYETGKNATRDTISSWFTRDQRVELGDSLAPALQSDVRGERADALSGLLAGYDTDAMDQAALRDTVGDMLDGETCDDFRVSFRGCASSRLEELVPEPNPSPPYSFTEVQSTEPIEEQQWARGNDLRFSTFNSCIGVVGRAGTELTGAHLVLFGEEGNAFNEGAAQTVANLMAGSEETAVFGFTDIWQASVPDAYTRLRDLLPNVRILPPAPGTEANFHVSIDQGTIQVRNLGDAFGGPNDYRTEVQWGGDSAPWNDNGMWVIGNRDDQRAVALDITSNDDGETFVGTMQYAAEGPIGFRGTHTVANQYETEIQWGGDSAPWHHNGTWVIGARDDHRVIAVDIQSSDNGESFTGTMQHAGEGPIGFRANRDG